MKALSSGASPPRSRLGLLLRKIAWFSVSLVTLSVVRATLTLASYKRVSRWMPRVPHSHIAPAATINRCAWALTKASRLVPGASCLTQALSGQWLLGRLGYTSTVVIGVAGPGPDAFRAHAWLRSGQTVIVGGDEEDLADFTQLTELNAST